MSIDMAVKFVLYTSTSFVTYKYGLQKPGLNTMNTAIFN